MPSSSRSRRARVLLSLLAASLGGCGSSAPAPDGGTNPDGDASVLDAGTSDARVTPDASDACDPNPCGDLNCGDDGSGGFVCCPPPFGGLRCSSLDWCTTQPCMNGATCTHIDDRTVDCDCTPGFVGTLCELADPCATNPCANGGTCASDALGAATCTCTPPYAGDTCETVDLCTTSPCLNGGTCTRVSDEAFTCACASGFVGDTCAYADACLSNPCLNGGTCTNDMGGFTCACTLGYSGATCLTNVNDCPTPNPCLNGGTCVDGLDDYSCACATNFGGDDCAVACGATATAVADGNWNAPATWGGVVPTSGTFVLIPAGRTVTIPVGVSVRSVACAGIRISGALVNRGQLTTDAELVLRGLTGFGVGDATLTNEGTLVLDGGMAMSSDVGGLAAFTNTASGAVTSRGAVIFQRLVNGGTWTIHGTASCGALCGFDNSGTVTIAAGATLALNVASGNGGTILNHGTFRSNRPFENRGTFTNAGTLETVFDQQVGCPFTNGATGTLTNTGTVTAHCVFASYGALTTTGTFDVRGVLRAYGTFTNETSGVLRIAAGTEIHGTLVNRGRLSVQPDGDVSVYGMLMNHGTVTVTEGFRARAGGTVHIAAGSLLEAFSPIGNWGTYDVYGTLALLGMHGNLNNQGTVHQRCGSTVTLSRGASSWFGTAAMVESPCP